MDEEAKAFATGAVVGITAASILALIVPVWVPLLISVSAISYASYAKYGRTNTKDKEREVVDAEVVDENKKEN